ncbi:hypothetical protein B1R94_02125 [Mycolicibacterium litorale]|nr:hypothetical protein B1R94_02125 [Mycolicibacterium litorale]
MSYDRRAELRETSEAAAERAAGDRVEYSSARRSSGGTCPPGRHRPVPTRNGGGVCACGFVVDRDEVADV